MLFRASYPNRWLARIVFWGKGQDLLDSMCRIPLSGFRNFVYLCIVVVHDSLAYTLRCCTMISPIGYTIDVVRAQRTVARIPLCPIV